MNYGGNIRKENHNIEEDSLTQTDNSSDSTDPVQDRDTKRENSREKFSNTIKGVLYIILSGNL